MTGILFDTDFSEHDEFLSNASAIYAPTDVFNCFVIVTI